MSKKLKVKLERLQGTKYEYEYTHPNGDREHYEWKPAKVGYKSIVEIPSYVFEDMMYNSLALVKGKLVVVENEEKQEEVLRNVGDLDLYAEQTLGVDKIKELLEGSTKNLKTELSQVKDVDTYKKFVTVAKEIKLDSSSKLKLLSQYVGIPMDVLFETEF